MVETGTRPGWTVMVDDNFRYMEEDARCRFGVFATLGEALATCRRIVEQSLANVHQPGMPAEELLRRYKTFGQDPFIVGPADVSSSPLFSAWDYAGEHAAKICRAGAPDGSRAYQLSESVPIASRPEPK